ncbi:MAG: hypothetical protein NY202_02575 [Mollicutes bacterium UO1]
MLIHVSQQREKLARLIRVIKEGEEIFKKKDVEQIGKFLIYLEVERKMAQKSQGKVFFSKIIEINNLVNELDSTQQQAQIIHK